MSTPSEEHRISAAERVYRWVKQHVLDGSYEGGRLITEGDVAAQVEVSRTPVREAFLRLEVEGLLQLYPKRGALVVPVSVTEFAEVTEARILLETFAAEKAVATGRHPAVAAAMRELLERQRRIAMPAGGVEFSEVDRRFHETLVAASDNALVGQFYGALGDRQLRMFASALRRAPARHEAILADHDRLCALLEAGDVPGIRTLLRDHIGATHGALR